MYTGRGTWCPSFRGHGLLSQACCTGVLTSEKCVLQGQLRGDFAGVWKEGGG